MHYIITIHGHSINELTEEATTLAQAILDDTFIVTDFHIEEDEQIPHS